MPEFKWQIQLTNGNIIEGTADSDGLENMKEAIKKKWFLETENGLLRCDAVCELKWKEILPETLKKVAEAEAALAKASLVDLNEFSMLTRQQHNK